MRRKLLGQAGCTYGVWSTGANAKRGHSRRALGSQGLKNVPLLEPRVCRALPVSLGRAFTALKDRPDASLVLKTRREGWVCREGRHKWRWLGVDYAAHA